MNRRVRIVGDRPPAWRAGVLVILVFSATMLTGCHGRTRLGVSTTVVPLTGNCNKWAVVEVGASLPLTGSLATLGREELVGLQVGVNKIDHDGGVMSSDACLELMYKDDRSNPSVDEQALLDLVNEEHVSLVTGPFLALQNPANRADLGSLGVTAESFSGVDETFEPRSYPYTFPLGASASAVAGTMTSYVKRNGWRRVLVVEAGEGSSLESAGAFVTAAEHRQLVVVGKKTVNSVGTASSALRSLGSGQSETVVVFDDGSTLSPLLVERRALRSSIRVVAVTDATLPDLPASDLTGVDVLVPSALSIAGAVPAEVATLRDKVVDASGTTRVEGSLIPFAQAYDAVDMFAAAAKGVNADDAGSLRTYMENANYQGVLGSYSYTSGYHSGLGASQYKVVPLDTLVDGVFVDGRGER